MANMRENIAPTDLTHSYAKDHFGQGTLYHQKMTAGGTQVDRLWCWGRNVDATVTLKGKVPCTRMTSTTSQGLFTADSSDAYDLEARNDVGIQYCATTVPHKYYCWFFVKGVGKMRQCTTSASVAIYDPFRVVGDKAVDTSATHADMAGIFLEEPGLTASLEKYVKLDGFNFG